MDADSHNNTPQPDLDLPRTSRNDSHDERSSSSRSSRARERIERRRQRQQHAVRAPRGAGPSTGPKRPRVKREGSLELPKINIRYLQYIGLGVAAILFMLAVIFGVGLFTDNPIEAAPNAIWIGPDWTYTAHDDATMRQYVVMLRQHDIGTVYARVSELNFDGSWTGRVDGNNQFEEVRQEVTAFAAQFKRLYPDVQLIGTLGIPADLGGEDGYRLDDENLWQVVADFSSQVVGSLGFDGVMLDVEPVWDGDDAYLNLVRQVRQRIGDDHLLAVAVPPDWTPTDASVPAPAVIADGTLWDQQYKQRLALIQPDQIVVRSYNSYLTDARDYSAWMAYQVEAFTEAIASLQADVDLLFGVPTYAESLPAHDEAVENVASALSGITQGLAAVGEDGEIIQGLAIYADWGTNGTEWSQFRELWVDR